MLDYKRNQYLSHILLTVLLGFSTIITTKIFIGNSILSYLRYLILFSVFSYVLISVNITKIPRKGMPIYIIWMLFACSTIISSLYTRGNLIDSLWYLIGVPVIFFIAFPKYFTSKPLKLVTITLFAGHLPYLLISLVTSVPRYPYEGVFANPNQMGILGVILGCCSLIILNSQIKSRGRMKSIILFASFVLISLLVVFISGSRTSLIVFVMLMFIFLSINMNILSRYKIKANVVISLVAAFILYSAYLHYGDALNGMITKMQYYSNQSNIFSGRLYIWRTTIGDISLLGHGSRYFQMKFGLNAHNSLIDILGEYGAISAIFMILFAGFGLILALRFYNRYKRNDNYAIAPLMIMILFWGLSMGEGLFGSLGRGITVAYYVIIGITVYQYYNKNEVNIKDKNPKLEEIENGKSKYNNTYI